MKNKENLKHEFCLVRELEICIGQRKLENRTGLISTLAVFRKGLVCISWELLKKFKVPLKSQG
jgi:hypothetical protein